MKMRKRNGFGVLLILLTGSAAPPSGGAVAFENFFAGRTEGRGVLKEMFKRPQQIAVHGRGTLSQMGELTLEQDVEQPGKSVKHRTWRIRPSAAGYIGTLSDATGPVSITRHGLVARIEYTSVDGYYVIQELTPGGRAGTIENSMKIRKWGVTVATLEETIARLG